MADKQQLSDNSIRRWSNTMGLIGGGLLLIITWAIIFMMMAAFTEGWLAPWDTQRFRPPPGTWERMVNDFFERVPGSVMPALSIILISSALYIYSLFKFQHKTKLTWMFVSINLLFIGIEAILAPLAHQLPDLWLSQPRPLIDVGYHRTWPAVVATIILLIFLFVIQARFMTQKSN